MELLVEPEAMLAETTEVWGAVFHHNDPATEQGLEGTFANTPTPELPLIDLPKWTAADIALTGGKMKKQVARGADHWSVT